MSIRDIIQCSLYTNYSINSHVTFATNNFLAIIWYNLYYTSDQIIKLCIFIFTLPLLLVFYKNVIYNVFNQTEKQFWVIVYFLIIY